MPLYFTIGETIITGKFFFLNVTMFLILCYEYDYNTVGHKVFIVVHSLEYRLRYCEAIVSIKLPQSNHIASLLSMH